MLLYRRVVGANGCYYIDVQVGANGCYYIGANECYYIDVQQERPRRGPGNQIYLIANPATTNHQEHVPRIKIIPLLDNRYDAFDYDNHICEH